MCSINDGHNDETMCRNLHVIVVKNGYNKKWKKNTLLEVLKPVHIELVPRIWLTGSWPKTHIKNL